MPQTPQEVASIAADWRRQAERDDTHAARLEKEGKTVEAAGFRQTATLARQAATDAELSVSTGGG